MASPEIIDVQNSEQAQAAMRAVVQDTMNRLAGFDPSYVLAQDVLAMLRRWHLEYFRKDTSPAGEKWPPLAEATKMRKGHGLILEETLALLYSLIGRNKWSIARIRRDGRGVRLDYGTRRPDAWKHQTGEGVPRRTFLGVDDEKLDKVAAAVADAAVRHMQRRPQAAGGAAALRRAG